MGKRQFLMDTGSHCFLCLRVARTGGGVPKLSSFQNICQYLNLSLRGILAETVSSATTAPLPLLEESEVKGTLCEDCSRLAKRFSEHFHELEVLRMRVEFDMKSIYERMVEVKSGTSLEEEFQREMLRRPGSLAQYGIVDRLRRKTIEKCSRKFQTAPPRVSLEQFTDAVMVTPGDSDVKMECIPDMDLMLPTAFLESSFFDITGETGGIDESCLVQCDICHARVTDLFAHLATAHSETQGDTADLLGPGPPPRKGRGGGERPGMEIIIPPFGLSQLGLGHQGLAAPPPIVMYPNPNDQARIRQGSASASALRCDICGKGFSIKSSLDRHLKNVHHHSQGQSHHHQHKCDLCGKMFTQRSALNRHRRATHFANVLKGSEVIRVDGRPSSKPNPTIPEPIPKETDLLNLVTLLNNRGKQGQLINTPKPQSSSATSKAPPKSNQGQGDQPQSIINVETGRHTCSVCSKEFKDNGSFLIHYRSTHLTVKYECTVCGKEFDNRNEYGRHHQEAHTGAAKKDDLPHKCHKCGQTFSLRIILLQHQRNKKNCGMMKSRPTPTLNRVQSHRGAAAVLSKKGKMAVCTCQVCGRGFARSSDLQRHFKAVHMEGSEHGCHLCDKVFKQKQNLFQHLLQVHKISGNGSTSSTTTTIQQRAGYNNGRGGSRSSSSGNNLYSVVVLPPAPDPDIEEIEFLPEGPEHDENLMIF